MLLKGRKEGRKRASYIEVDGRTGIVMLQSYRMQEEREFVMTQGYGERVNNTDDILKPG